MKRRLFVKLASVSPVLPLIFSQCNSNPRTFGFEIEVNSDGKAGHLVRKSVGFPHSNTRSVETLIVGGGLAGLTAAYQLRDRDFLLCELSSTLGGSSAAHTWGDLRFAQGAHYDMDYPDYYGEEVLSLLEEMGLIVYEPWRNSWTFKDHQYVIPHQQKYRCYDNGEWRYEVLKEGPEKGRFLDTLSGFLGEMKLPTRLIKTALHHLNQISFTQYLDNQSIRDASLRDSIDYLMLDDYGGKASEVSALAGIHHFMCRPYFQQPVKLFSPPQGNDYFVEHLAKSIDHAQLLTGHLVKSIRREGGVYQVEVINIAQETIDVIKTQNVIYAGQKHALQYILPEAHPQFAHNRYAPWVVVNLVLNNEAGEFSYWQNELIQTNEHFLGFIDSNSQHESLPDTRVLTAYFCYPTASRSQLLDLESKKGELVYSVIEYIDQFLGTSIETQIQRAFIKVMGHAMPIPGPGYLFNDANQIAHSKGLAFAGVDNGRLPLLFEALDSGIMAVKSLGF